MSAVSESEFEDNGWDRTFLDLSSKMAEPFCTVWHLLRFRLVAPLDLQKFENRATIVSEIATRAFIVCNAVFTSLSLAAVPTLTLCGIAMLGIGSRVFRAIGFALQKGDYTHVRGEAQEKSLEAADPTPKIMTWNVCGIGGGLALDHGGVLPWQSRLDAIVKKIKEEDPDVLILQEIYDTALSEALIDKLKKDYAHFFTHLGPNVWGSVGGCMVLSKCAVHQFSNTSFTNNDWKLNRGFATLEIKATPKDPVPSVRIIGTHLIDGYQPKDQKLRAEQLAQIVDSVAKKHLALPTVLAGDFNIERDQNEGSSLHFLHHSYLKPEYTRTNRLVLQWDPTSKDPEKEMIDYISLFKKGPQATFHNCHLVRAFDKSYNTKTALSDHHGLCVELRGLKV